VARRFRVVGRAGQIKRQVACRRDLRSTELRRSNHPDLCRLNTSPPRNSVPRGKTLVCPWQISAIKAAFLPTCPNPAQWLMPSADSTPAQTIASVGDDFEIWSIQSFKEKSKKI
jgi:hypothetical protein